MKKIHRELVETRGVRPLSRYVIDDGRQDTGADWSDQVWKVNRKFNELKLYYLSAGTERLMKLFGHLAELDPDIYLVISNGAYLSPWWLMHVDAVWMINAGDAAGGSFRTAELVYRDGRYHKIFQQENTRFPLNALFNHEPKKTKTGESKKAFRDYLYMHLSRGTGFVELYIKPFDAISDKLVLVKGGLRHEIKKDGTLNIENHYTARK